MHAIRIQAFNSFVISTANRARGVVKVANCRGPSLFLEYNVYLVNV